MLAIRSGNSEIKIKAAVKRFLFVGTLAFIAGQLADLYLKSSEYYSVPSFSVYGYAALSVCTIASILYHLLRTSTLEGKALHRFFETHGISRREKEIVDLLIRGFSNRRIADMLFISVSTVKSHTGSIYHKLGINSRMELVSILKTGIWGGAVEKDLKKHTFL
jgi:DNA-binding CsgD family transcriptional regulator